MVIVFRGTAVGQCLVLAPFLGFVWFSAQREAAIPRVRPRLERGAADQGDGSDLISLGSIRLST
jgi:hypothetical protein